MIDRRSAIWPALCIGLTFLILWLTLVSADSGPPEFGWDKLNHVGAIAAATGLAYLSLRPHRWAAAAAFLYGTFLGLLIEVLQGALTDSRVAEWSDVAADLIGAGCAWGVIRMYQRRVSSER